MRRALAAVIAALGTYPVTAHAQSRDDLARADAMFNAGKALTDSGQYADACSKFAESKRLAPGLGVTLYLADCYEHIGRSASAWTEFRSAEGLARERNDKRAEVARARAQAIEPKLNRLTIAVSPAIPRSGLQVLRDGVPVADEELGLAEPVDPGDHVVVISAPGHKMRSFDAHVGAEHQTATVQIESLDDDASATPAPVPIPPSSVETASSQVSAWAMPAPGASPAATRPSTQRWIGVGVGALGVVGVGIGGVLGVVAMSKRDESNSGASPPCNAQDACTAGGLSLRKEAESAATGSTIAFIGGGLALAAGVVLYVTAPRGSPVTGVVLVPAPIAGGGGAIVRASF